MRIISKIAKIILTIMVMFVITLSVFFVILKNGIEIKEFEYQNLSIERLYIKFDKKLLIDAKNIQIPQNSNSDSNITAADLNKIFSYVPYLDKYFKEVNLENLKVGNDTITALFKDNIFYVNTPYLKIDTKLIPKEDGYDVAIYEFSLSGFDLLIAGDGHMNLKDKFYKFDGFFQTHEINGKLDFEIKNALLKYNVSSATAKSIKNFMNELGFKTEMDRKIKEWIYGKVVAGFYDIEYLKGEIDITNLEYHLDKMEAFGTAYNLNVAFNETLPPVSIESSKITLDNGSLHFDLINPTFEGRDLNGSEVVLVDFMDGDTKVFVNIQTNSMLDKTILDILKGYDINVPVLQKSGKLNSDTNLKITISPFAVDVNVTASLEDANLELGGTNFYSKKADIFIDNSSINLKNSSLSMPNIFNASNINGKVDLKSSTAKFDAKFNQAKVENIYNRKNFNSVVNLNFKDDILIDIPGLNLNIALGKNINTINVLKLSDVIPYSSLLSDLKVSSGSAVIKSKEFKNFDIEAKNVVIDTPFTRKSGKKYSKDDVSIRVQNGIINGTTKSGLVDFYVKNGNTFVTINNLDFILKSGEKGGGFDFPNITFEGKNSNLIIESFNKNINFDTYSGNLNKQNIRFEGVAKNGGNITLLIRPEIVSITARNINSFSVNNLIGNQSFNGGTFSFKLVGDSFEKFQAEILMNDTFLTDYIFYQQLLSFLDSVPSLLKLKTPDFNTHGFSVKSGKLYFTKNNNIIDIQGMNFLGSSADIAGTGGINLNTGNINVDLEIIYLKDASSILDNIPILNQILLGRDRVFSTIVEVRGTLKKPTYTNKAVSDVVLSPFNIIRNVLELPVSLFD